MRISMSLAFLFSILIALFGTSNLHAEGVEPWEASVWCDYRPAFQWLDEYGTWRTFRRPVDFSVCEKIKEHGPPPSLESSPLTITEFNEIFEFSVGDQWMASVASYGAIDFLNDKTPCIPEVGAGLDEFRKYSSSDIALLRHAKSSLFGLAKPGVAKISSGLEDTYGIPPSTEFFSSAARLLQSDDYNKDYEVKFYSALVFALDYSMRKQLLDHGFVWHESSFGSSPVFSCETALDYWLDLASDAEIADRYSALSGIKFAVTYFLLENMNEIADNLQQSIEGLDRLEFLCGNTNSILRDRLVDTNGPGPVRKSSREHISRYVKHIGMEEECESWRTEVFNVAAQHFDDFFEESGASVPSPYEYVSPFK